MLKSNSKLLSRIFPDNSDLNLEPDFSLTFNFYVEIAVLLKYR